MAREKDKPDTPPGTPFQRVLPILITAAIVVVIAPSLLPAYWINSFSTMACLTIVAASVALLYGQLGMVSLAQFALCGVGGWICLRLAHGLALPFEVCLLAAAVGAGLFGLLVGLPALRMRGLYLALLTLMVAAAFQVVVNVTGFPDGGPGFTGKVVAGARKVIERPWIATSDAAYFRYTLFWLAAALSLVEWQRATMPGRAWALIRKSEAAALAAGVSVFKYKAWAFAFGGFLAGLAGGLLAGLEGQLDEVGFPTSQSILAFALTVVGGAYHWVGAVVAGLLMRALPALLNGHGVDGNLANAFYGLALLVSLIQGRKGLAGQLADFYKFVRVSRILEGTLTWGLIAIILGFGFQALGWNSFGGAFFLTLVALLFRIAIPGVCWLLLGFFGKPVQDWAEEQEARLSLPLVAWMESVGLVPNHRLIKNILNWLFIALFVAWVAWGVFDVDYIAALVNIVLAMTAIVVLKIALYPGVLPLRDWVDKRFPKPLAAYR
jgi:branched-chain amino acid transport system permease protein